MDRILKTIVWLTVCITIAATLGCEPQEPTSERQERLYSVENMELKKQIAELKEQSEKDIQAKQKELDQCNKDKTVLEQQIHEQVGKVFEESMMDMLGEQVEKLTEENMQLKAQIEELSKKAEQ